MNSSSSYIDSDSLINKDEYKSFEHLYICSICNGILIEPMQCQKCENCFCSDCISQWAKKSVNCPFNCRNLIIKPSKIMKTLLSKMVFECPNNCKESIKYLDYNDHHLNTCSKINAKGRYEQLIAQLNELRSENIQLKKSEYKIPYGGAHSFVFKSKNHHYGLVYCQTTKPVAQCKNCEGKITPFEGGYYCSFCDYDYCNNCYHKEYVVTNTNNIRSLFNL